jgi:ABC-2 type transport system permease protein
MTTLLRNEWTKLTTVRSPWLLLAGGLAVVLMGASGRLARGGDSPEVLPEAAAHVGLVALFALLLGVLSVAGEYRHRTITDTYLGTPRRGRVLTAKLVVSTLVGLGYGLAAAVLVVAWSAGWLAVAGDSGDWSDAGLWQTLTGCVLWNGLFAAVGVGVGALVRNLTGAIAGSLAWLALVEGVLGQVLGRDLARWLPFSAGTALGGLPAGSGLEQWTGGVVLLEYAVVITLAAVAGTLRRDVT